MSFKNILLFSCKGLHIYMKSSELLHTSKQLLNKINKTFNFVNLIFQKYSGLFQVEKSSDFETSGVEASWKGEQLLPLRVLHQLNISIKQGSKVDKKIYILQENETIWRSSHRSLEGCKGPGIQAYFRGYMSSTIIKFFENNQKFKTYLISYIFSLRGWEIKKQLESESMARLICLSLKFTEFSTLHTLKISVSRSILALENHNF